MRYRRSSGFRGYRRSFRHGLVGRLRQQRGEDNSHGYETQSKPTSAFQRGRQMGLPVDVVRLEARITDPISSNRKNRDAQKNNPVVGHVRPRGHVVVLLAIEAGTDPVE